jgi:DNA-binding SARP family transcriptional activator/WD40 repeat protein
VTPTRSGDGPRPGAGSSAPRGNRGSGGAVFEFPAAPADGHRYGDRVRFGVLGTLTVLDDDGGVVRLGGPARRRLLAALLARLGCTVAVDSLIEDLWSDAPPPTAEKTLQSHVVRLRDDLGRDAGPSPVLTEPGGYRLAVDRANVDAWCFERDLVAGRSTLAAGDPAAARPMLDQALSWWRGLAYAEFPDPAFAVSERLRLGELRILGEEARTDASLALGAGAELVADLERRVREEPYRERTWEQLVVALYRSGRQGDALAAYRRARERLVDDLGLEPAPSLRALEGRILDQDPTLLSPVPTAGVVVALSPHSAASSLPAAPLAGNAVPVALPDGSVIPLDGHGPPLSMATRAVGTCPYRGLAAYREDDAPVFVGRERLTAELAGRLVDNDLMVLTGPSGAGKSSLLRAGLLPALRRGAIPGSAAWRVEVVTPGADPLSALDGVHADLLAVDQAEELFTLAPGADRAAVGRRLAALLSAGTRLVLVLRADFYGRLAELAVFTGRIGAATMLVGPLTEEEVRRVVVEPSAAAGVPAVPGLAEAVVADVRGQAGSLPLLSAALERTWHERTGDRLSLEAYHDAGGVRGALESMAEESFGSLDPPAQAAARRMLLRMATRSGGAWARRPVPISEVAPEGDDAARRALARLADARLLTVGSTSAELAHEALLGGWPRLRAWLDERALVADQLEHLSTSASAWEQAGRTEPDLLRGPRLQASLDWSERHPDDLSALERTYVLASQTAVGAELTRERGRRRRLATATVAATATAVVAAMVGGIALVERSNADRSALSADARRLAAQSYTVPDRTTSLLLAAASYRLQDSPDTRGALLSAVQADGGAIFRIPTGNYLHWVGTPADGSRVLVVDNSHHVLVLDPVSRRVTSSFPLEADVGDISPDGSTLALCGTQSGAVTILDAHTGAVLHQLSVPATESVSPQCAQFTGDGRHLIAAALVVRPDGTVPAGGDLADALAVYDTRNWATPPRLLQSAIPIAAFDTGTDRVAVQHSDESLEILQADDLHVVAAGRPAGAATCTAASERCVVAINPAGTRVAFLDPADPRTFEQMAVPEGALAGTGRLAQGLGTAVTHLAFSPDGTRIAAAADDGSVLVATVPDAATVLSQTGNGATQGMAWAGSGSTAALYTGGLDSELVSWDLRSVPRTIRLGPAMPVDDGDDTVVGHWIVGTRPFPGTSDGAEDVFRTDLRTGASVAWPLPIHAGMYLSWLQPSRDGTLAVLSFASSGADSQALRFEVVDLRTGATLYDQPATAPPGADPSISFAAAASADDRTLYAVTGQHTIRVVDLANGRLVRTMPVQFMGAAADLQWPIPVAVDPRGRLLMLAYQPRTLTAAGSPAGALPQRSESLALVDPDTGRVDAQADLGSVGGTVVAWSPDGSELTLGTLGGTIEAFDAATLAPLTNRVVAHHGVVVAVSYSADGSMVATSGNDGTVAMWDAKTLRRIGTPTTLGHLGAVFAWFTGTGGIAGVMPRDITDATPDTWFTMPGTPQAWLSDACAFAGRDLTRTEWAQYVGDQPYRTTCPSSG